MWQAWAGLTEGQGAVLASIITLIAALGGVILGWWLFAGKVKDLETALGRSDTAVQAHVQAVENRLSAHEGRLNEQLATIALQVGKLSGSVADFPIASIPEGATSQQNAQEQMRDLWARIRDRLEAIAADPRVDGRTRAKYGRIDRRRYGDLVAALDADQQLAGAAPAFRQAVDLWQRFRTGRAIPTPDDIAQMGGLADRVE